ncbi:MAG: DUF3168 domain-containing protein [Betaproteobacteria bacterium]
MRAEKVVYTLLTGSSQVTALVGLKIYPGLIPQNTTMPALTYELVSGVDIAPINAQAGGVIMRSRVQISALARTYAEVKTIHEAIRCALLFKSGLISDVQVLAITRELIGSDERDDESGLYMQAVDYLLTHDET